MYFLNVLKPHCPTCSYLLPLYRKLHQSVPVGPPWSSFSYVSWELSLWDSHLSVTLLCGLIPSGPVILTVFKSDNWVYLHLPLFSSSLFLSLSLSFSLFLSPLPLSPSLSLSLSLSHSLYLNLCLILVFSRSSSGGGYRTSTTGTGSFR